MVFAYFFASLEAVWQNFDQICCSVWRQIVVFLLNELTNFNLCVPTALGFREFRLLMLDIHSIYLGNHPLLDRISTAATADISGSKMPNSARSAEQGHAKQKGGKRWFCKRETTNLVISMWNLNKALTKTHLKAPKVKGSGSFCFDDWWWIWRWMVLSQCHFGDVIFSCTCEGIFWLYYQSTILSD